MADLKNNRFLKLFGICTIIYWVSLIVYVPPIAPIPNIRGLLGEIDNDFKREVLKWHKPDEIIEAKVMKDVMFHFAKQYAIILLGVSSGILIIMRRRIGKIIALCLCSFFIIIKIMSIADRYPYYFQQMKMFYDYAPGTVIYIDIVGTIFMLFTILYLATRSFENKYIGT
jgi:hypothetical protein